MITEDYVSFETAKLLKEKGFNDEYTNAFYDKSGILYFIDLLSDFSEHPNNDTDIAASTLYVAMKWLREIHKIFIDVDYDSDEFKDSSYFSLIINMNTNDYFKGCGLPQEKSTYEEACEAAIKYCLEKLI